MGCPLRRIKGIPQDLGSVSPLPSSVPGTINIRENKAKPSKKVRGGRNRDSIGLRKPYPLLVNGVISWGFYLWAFLFLFLILE